MSFSIIPPDALPFCNPHTKNANVITSIRQPPKLIFSVWVIQLTYEWTPACYPHVGVPCAFHLAIEIQLLWHFYLSEYVKCAELIDRCRPSFCFRSRSTRILAWHSVQYPKFGVYNGMVFFPFLIDQLIFLVIDSLYFYRCESGFLSHSNKLLQAIGCKGHHFIFNALMINSKTMARLWFWAHRCTYTPSGVHLNCNQPDKNRSIC